MELPANESRKLALGSGTLAKAPPRTACHRSDVQQVDSRGLTHPVTPINSSKASLSMKKKFMPRTPTLGKKVCTRVMADMTTMAMPRSSHSVAVRPAATTMLDAKTMQPLAVPCKLKYATALQTIRTSEPQKNDLNRKNNRGQHARMLVCCFEIDLFSTASRNHASQLQPHEHASKGDDATSKPQ